MVDFNKSWAKNVAVLVVVISRKNFEHDGKPSITHQFDAPSDFKQGDEVFGQAGVISGGSGAFAEMAVANVKSIADKPKRLSYTEVGRSTPCGCRWRAY